MCATANEQAVLRPPARRLQFRGRNGRDPTVRIEKPATVLLGHCEMKGGWGQGIVLRLCSAVPRGFGNEQVSSVRWVGNPKFCPHIISCRRGVDSVACRGIFFPLGLSYRPGGWPSTLDRTHPNENFRNLKRSRTQGGVPMMPECCVSFWVVY